VTASDLVEARADLKLIASARSGDEEAFVRLTAQHRAALHAHCYRLLGSLHDADDALQETLLRAWRGIAGFEPRAPLAAWLYRIANGQPALAAFADEHDQGRFEAYGLMVFAIDGDTIAGITGFPRQPELFVRIGLPTQLG
jgi:hypothetical protein